MHTEGPGIWRRRLQACGELLGIALLDHIIVGGHTYLSMREEKILIR